MSYIIASQRVDSQLLIDLQWSGGVVGGCWEFRLLYYSVYPWSSLSKMNNRVYFRRFLIGKNSEWTQFQKWVIYVTNHPIRCLVSCVSSQLPRIYSGTWENKKLSYRRQSAHLTFLYRTVQKTFLYVEPFRRGSRVWDRRTDGQVAVSHSAL